MRACYVVFEADRTLAHDMAKVLATAPEDAILHAVVAHDFGRQIEIAFKSTKFAYVPAGMPLPNVTPMFDGDKVHVPWPLERKEDT